MRIATWNLESVRPLTPAMAGAFRQAMAGVGADVWVLTETREGFSPREGFRQVAVSCPAADLAPWPARRWVAIWAKSGQHATSLEVRCQEDRMACGSVEAAGGRAVVVVGTVLPWLSDNRWPGAEGFCAALALQVAEWGRLWRAAGNCARVVAGDFNQSLPYEQHYGSRQGADALGGALHAHGLLCLTEGHDPLTGQPRIDHICVGRADQGAVQPTPAGTWPVPFVGGEPVTDQQGAYADLGSVL